MTQEISLVADKEQTAPLFNALGRRGLGPAKVAQYMGEDITVECQGEECVIPSDALCEVKIPVDDSSVDEIRELADYYCLSGTTPSVLEI